METLQLPASPGRALPGRELADSFYFYFFDIAQVKNTQYKNNCYSKEPTFSPINLDPGFMLAPYSVKINRFSTTGGSGENIEDILNNKDKTLLFFC